jgi:Second Messenger Oligonucleotide or Dinucleotide Synthetase domain
MNVAFPGPWPQLSEADALLMDVARRIQLSKTKHETAEQNFRALCQHVDREGSPLHNRVIECYPSGSFATGTAIASRVAKNQHDVDVVIELDVAATTDPQTILDLLFEAINGEEGSRYFGRVTQNSRCVTVTYDDGTTVDLMPVARIDGPDRAGHLFHFKPENSEKYHKPVNPWGFADHFNRHVEFDPAFHELFKGRRLLVEGEALLKADTQPMPAHVPIEEKSPRIVGIQLIKRSRDITWRQPARRRMRKPPSVALAAISLDAGPVATSLVDETIAIANAIRTRLQDRSSPRGTVHVLNPAYRHDVFTDRWPEDINAQNLYDADLRRLIVQLYRLRNDNLSLEEKSELLKALFGESAAAYAIESHLNARRREMEASRLQIGPKGKVVTGLAAPAIAASPRTTAARPATREGGGHLPE